MDHSLESFYKVASEEFGEDKFSISGIQISQENLDKFNSEHSCNLTIEDFDSYKAVWVLSGKCPNCDSELGGLFGSFTWGIVHGNGYCNECKKTSFQLYHYVKDCKYPIQAYSLIGFR